MEKRFRISIEEQQADGTWQSKYGKAYYECRGYALFTDLSDQEVMKGHTMLEEVSARFMGLLLEDSPEGWLCVKAAIRWAVKHFFPRLLGTYKPRIRGEEK